jgi:hypothetical protein
VTAAEHAEVVADERRARTRHRALEKARRAKIRLKQGMVWRHVKAAIRLHGCTCDLRPGMSWEQLLELGEGCTGKRAHGYVCPALDCYRRLLGVPRR